MSMEETGAGQSKKSHKKVVVIVILVIVALVAVAGFRLADQYLNPQTEQVDDSISVKVEEAVTGNIEVTSVHTGKVTAEKEVNVIPKIAGKVSSVKVSLGDKVSEGDVLFKVDPSDVESQQNQALIQRDAAASGRSAAGAALDNARKAKKKAEETLNNIKKQIKTAKKAVKEAEKAGPMGAEALARAQAALDQLKSAKAQADSGVLQAKSGVTQAQSAYDQAGAQYRLADEGVNAAGNAIAETKVKAPISGYVTAVSVQKGGMVSQAMPAVVITGTKELKVTTTVAESYVDSIKTGEPVDIYIRALSDEPFAGTIDSIVPAPPTGQTTYPVVIGFDDIVTGLNPGMFAEVVITTGKAESVITIPSNALMIRGGKEIVAVLEPSNTVRLVEVTSGIDDGTRVEVTSGISLGDRVIYVGQQYVNEDSKVKVAE